MFQLIQLQEWEDWNNELQVKNENFLGFDGIDWDLEGDDDGIYETLNPTVLEIVGEMSQVSNDFIEYLLFFRNFVLLG